MLGGKRRGISSGSPTGVESRKVRTFLGRDCCESSVSFLNKGEQFRTVEGTQAWHFQMAGQSYNQPPPDHGTGFSGVGPRL